MKTCIIILSAFGAISFCANIVQCATECKCDALTAGSIEANSVKDLVDVSKIDTPWCSQPVDAAVLEVLKRE